MKLSIVMMVKNEEKYLDKNLSSLKPIIENIDSELIILDTGSTDKTVEIAKKYTDKVYFEKWNNNFADMRNKSISYASGEWLLILDADEVIIKYDRLLEFFKTDKHKKYNCSSIEIINIMNITPSRKSISKIPRFFRNTANFKYTGIVHEQPKIVMPMYNSILTCEHYGYLFEDKQLQRKKLQRNNKLLTEQLKYESDNKHYIHSHLAMGYAQMGMITDALYHAEKGYEIVKNIIRYIPQDKMYAFQYQSYISILYYSSKIRKAYNVCLEYMKFDDKNIDILYYLSKLSMLLDMPSECIKYSNKYLYYINNYEKSSSYSSIYIKCETLDKKDEIYKNIIDSHIKLDEFYEALEIIDNGEFDKSKVYTQIIICLYKTKNIDRIIDIYKNIEINSKKTRFTDILEKTVKSKFHKDELDEVHGILSDLDDEYGTFNKYRLDKKYNLQLENILINKNELYYYEILDIYVSQEKTIPNILKTIHDEKLETMFIYCVLNNFDFKFVLEDFILNVENTLDINLIRIYKIITKVLLFNAKLFEENYNQMFNLYMMYNNYYDKIMFDNIYNNNLICNIRNFEQMFIKELNDLESINDNVEYIKQLKNLALKYPNHNQSVEYLSKQFEKKINETDEVKILKKEFIDMISNNISKGNTEQIETLLEQYKELYGIDKETLNIYGILDIYKEDLDSAEINFKKALALDIYNADTVYNIAYLKELKEELKEAKLFYEFCKECSDEQDLINICNEKIDYLNNH